MSANNALLPSGKEQAAAGHAASLGDSRTIRQPVKAVPDDQDGSVWSHLLFGLVTLVLVLPMIIPGVPMNYLVIFYLGLVGVSLAGCVIWNFLNARGPKG